MTTYVGISAAPVDPSVAVVVDGELVSYVEEERLLRDKHASHRYPRLALRWALAEAGLRLDQVAAVAVPWDTEAFADGRIRAFYDTMARDHQLDEATRAWQAAKLSAYSTPTVSKNQQRVWRRMFGDIDLPPLRGVPHHFAHAVQAGMQSPFENSIVLTADGSGDTECTVLWEHRDQRLTRLRQIMMPHSLGWFYAAVTEYLGFEAYDEEYKVMGLAAYGRPNEDLARRFRQVLRPAADGVEYRIDPGYIHYGSHRYSGRFTDALVGLLGQTPRTVGSSIGQWHRDVAYAAQQAIQDALCRLVDWAIVETGVSRVALGGGVAANVIANGAILEGTEATSVFAHPLCTDAGVAAGAAMALSLWDGVPPERLNHVAVGPKVDNRSTQMELRRVGCTYEVVDDVAAATAAALANGAIVGWCDGRLEGGARSLGQRSILADPRLVGARDRVNAAVKMREPWRPFCPSMPIEAAADYLIGSGDYRFMTVGCRATQRLRNDAPALVHVDGMVRPQTVENTILPRFHHLLTEFGRITSVPVLLNTSFNLAGEPIVATVRDALRTFWSSGLDLLVIGDIIVRKPTPPA